MPPSFPLCIVICALISERWLNLETRAAFSYLKKLRGENPPCFSTIASMCVRWSAALYGHQASIEEYFSIVILCQGCSFNLDEFYSVCCTEGQQIKLLCYLEQSEFPTPFLFQASLRPHDSRSKKKKKNPQLLWTVAIRQGNVIVSMTVKSFNSLHQRHQSILFSALDRCTKYSTRGGTPTIPWLQPAVRGRKLPFPSLISWKEAFEKICLVSWTSGPSKSFASHFVKL